MQRNGSPRTAPHRTALPRMHALTHCGSDPMRRRTVLGIPQENSFRSATRRHCCEVLEAHARQRAADPPPQGSRSAESTTTCSIRSVVDQNSRSAGADGSCMQTSENPEAVSPANHSFDRSVDRPTHCGKSRIVAQLGAQADRSWRACSWQQNGASRPSLPSGAKRNAKRCLVQTQHGEPSPGTDVAGVSAVPAQMWQG